MKFSINRKKLYKALSQIQGITNNKTNLAITSDVLISSKNSKITVFANNLETVFEGTYDAEIESDGIISINSKKLYEILKEYPDFNILLNEIEDRWIEIGEGNIQYHIVTSNYKNFPEKPLIEDISFVEINSEDFKRMVEVSSTISFLIDEKRIYVLGVCLEKINNENKIRMVSTDSKKLTCFDLEYKDDFIIPDKGIIIPKKGISELNKFIEKDKKIKIGIKNNYFIVKKNNEIIMIKLLEGGYPDYKKIINTDTMIPIEINKAMFLMVMKRMSILCSEQYKNAIFNFKENGIVVTITNPEIGESKEEILVDYLDKNIKTSFNTRYFIDILNIINSENIILYIKNKKSPCVIKGIDDNKLISVIMPISI
ncbi:MAG: DNA polymerase III subunit beta [Desulfobacteraceae bacterium 4572_130]|nr:MAG: DNA polymerase III subunit beta [Desulfobacteraceae bacterium 4572_130]